MEKAMEEVFAGFTANGEAPGHISAGAKTALDGIANGHVFVLHPFADGDAFFVACLGVSGGVREVVIEDNCAAVHRQR